MTLTSQHLVELVQDLLVGAFLPIWESALHYRPE
jgi:hypothetical protein